MASSRKIAQAQLNHREWVKFQIDMEPDGRIVDVQWWAWGCHELLLTASRAAEKMKGQILENLSWNGVEHGDLLVQEAWDRLREKFKLPIDDPETCHCRKIATAIVDEAIVLGAHTPEKVTAWTSASTGCGTCRPDVEKLIAYRLKKI